MSSKACEYEGNDQTYGYSWDIDYFLSWGLFSEQHYEWLEKDESDEEKEENWNECRNRYDF